MYFIAFTRKLGAGGSEIAWNVARQLGYSFYDTFAIENAAREMGFAKDASEVEEKGPSLFARFFSSKELEIHLNRLNSVVYELASKGSAVFLGRGSHVLLRDFKCGLHVRVTASQQTRIQNLVARGLEEEVALKALRRSDHEREAFTRFAFGVDWDAPELYDMVLNMDHLTIDLAVGTVLHIARSEEIKARSVDAMSALRMLALRGRAEAALVEAGLSMNSLSLAISQPGRVHLTGLLHSHSDAARAEDAVRNVIGVESVENRIHIVPVEAPTPYPV